MIISCPSLSLQPLISFRVRVLVFPYPDHLNRSGCHCSCYPVLLDLCLWKLSNWLLRLWGNHFKLGIPTPVTTQKNLKTLQQCNQDPARHFWLPHLSESRNRNLGHFTVNDICPTTKFVRIRILLFTYPDLKIPSMIQCSASAIAQPFVIETSYKWSPCSCGSLIDFQSCIAGMLRFSRSRELEGCILLLFPGTVSVWPQASLRNRDDTQFGQMSPIWTLIWQRHFSERSNFVVGQNRAIIRLKPKC